MRRWLAAVATGCVVTLAACSSSTNLAAAGKPSPSPTASASGAIVPAVGDCFSKRGSELTASEKVPCSTHHWAEEAYIGTFEGDAAALVSLPVPNSAAIQDAYAQCATPTRRYIGGDWHEALMQLVLEIPPARAWSAGARWFRCELWASPLDRAAQAVGTDVSFRGVLAKPTPLLARCITWKGKDSGYDFQPASCSAPHNGEYVGAYVAPVGPWPATAKQQQDIAGDGCGDLVARFVGFPSWDELDNPYVAYYELGFDQEQWDMGDRSVRCYAAAYTKDGKFVGSVKGIRSRTPKG